MSESEVLYMRSSKKNTSKSSGGESSANEDDIWDDSLLVEAYDRAVQYAQQNCVKKKQGINKPSGSKSKANGNDSHMWKVGDKCKCPYSEDHNYYEADIIEITDSTGMCVVKYVGYENEETVPLKSLKPSEGDFVRFRQIQQSASENVNQTKLKGGSDISNNVGKKLQKNLSAKTKDSFLKKSHICAERSSTSSLTLNSPFPQVLNSIIPPPPPPHMFNNVNEDENENEAMSAMLISWYMSGYHTGYYQGLKVAKKQEQ